MRTILSTVGIAAAMLLVSGCCEPQQTPQAAYPSVNIPLLCDGIPACPPPHMADYRTAIRLKADGSAEQRVYDLGDGLVSNSSAVTLAGGRAKPLAGYREGGVGCILAKADKPSSSVLAPRAVATFTAMPAPSFDAQPYGICPVPEGSAAVCLPGKFMSDCFTLTDQDNVANTLDIYVPGVTSKYDAALNTVGSPASTTPAVAAPLPAPEVAPTTTASLAPPADSEDPTASMTPVPVVTDLNQMAETISPSPSDYPSSLPEVVLPPKLN